MIVQFTFCNDTPLTQAWVKEQQIQIIIIYFFNLYVVVGHMLWIVSNAEQPTQKNTSDISSDFESYKRRTIIKKNE